MQLWAVGLTTRSKAERATKWGAAACFLAAAREFLGIIVKLSLADKNIGSAIAWTVGASILPLIFAIAGFRMLARNGRFSGTLAVLFLGLDISMTEGYTPMAYIGAMVVKAALWLVIANGVRGAFAQKHVDYNKALRTTFN